MVIKCMGKMDFIIHINLPLETFYLLKKLTSKSVAEFLRSKHTKGHTDSGKRLCFIRVLCSDTIYF